MVEKGFNEMDGSNHSACISRTVCCSLDPVVGIGYSILCILCKINGTS